ncbi:MAG: aspartate/glutamate racemase family protein [Alphaproteobacteria bacterium]
MNITDITIGILAVTPEGGAKAYRDLTIKFYEKYGNYVSPHVLMYMQPLIQHVQNFGNEDKWTELIQQGVDKLVGSGAQLLWMPANSSHLVANRINFKGVEFVNMVDVSVASLLASGQRPLVLGTTVSMSEKLYFKDKRMSDHCTKPNAEDQSIVNDIIIKELVPGNISADSRQFIRKLVNKHQVSDGITSVFLACTELPCFFTSDELGLPVQNSIDVSADCIIARAIQLQNFAD